MFGRIVAAIPNVVSSPFRATARGLLRFFHRRRSRRFDSAELRASALVFAPHPDDETLGCGGTVALKRKLGADVTVAILTDGAASDPGASPEGLARLRRDEAAAACRALGVPPDRLLFLDFPDGRLSSIGDPAVTAIGEVLDRIAPAQVFIPYGVGEHPDHTAAGEIVMAALSRKRTSASPTVFEYPVWYWRHWPWVAQDRNLFGTSVRERFGLRLCRTFRTRVDIRDTLDQKRAALNEHRSQVTNARSDPAHPSLAEVSRGEFLKCFFEGNEWFREVPRREVQGPASGVQSHLRS